MMALDSVFDLYGQHAPVYLPLLPDEAKEIKLAFYKLWGFPKSYISPWQNWDMNAVEYIHINEIVGFVKKYFDEIIYVFFEFKEPIIYVVDRGEIDFIEAYVDRVYNIYIIDHDLAKCISITDQNIDYGYLARK